MKCRECALGFFLYKNTRCAERRDCILIRDRARALCAAPALETHLQCRTLPTVVVVGLWLLHIDWQWRGDVAFVDEVARRRKRPPRRFVRLIEAGLLSGRLTLRSWCCFFFFFNLGNRLIYRLILYYLTNCFYVIWMLHFKIGCGNIDKLSALWRCRDVG